MRISYFAIVTAVLFSAPGHENEQAAAQNTRDATIGTRAATNANEREATKFQGTWELVYGEYNGARLPDMPVKFEFKGDKYSVIRPKQGPPGDFTARFEIDASKSPKEIDVIIDKKVDRGIYMFVGDFLMLVYRTGEQRPKEFRSAPDSLHQLYFLKRRSQPAR